MDNFLEKYSLLKLKKEKTESQMSNYSIKELKQ